jgi:hypothetical protein
MSQSTPEALARAGIHRNAQTIVAGAAGAFTIGALAAAGIAPLLTGGLTAATLASLLTSLGGNALAGWLASWAERSGNRVLDADDSEAEQKLIVQLAHDLQTHLATNDMLAADVSALLQRLDAIPVAFEALQGQGEQQTRLLQRLAGDLESARVRNKQLHAMTLQAILIQGAALREAYAQSNADLKLRIDMILATVQALRPGDTVYGDKVGRDKIGGDKVGRDKMMIGNHYGSTQNVNISGGTVSGPIIGSQTNYYGAPPTPPADAATPSREDIDDQLDLLASQRQTLAIYLKRMAKLGEAHAPPEVFHGIRDARKAIRRVKETLRSWEQAVEDQPDDEA